MHLHYPMKANGMYVLSRTDMDSIAEQVLTEYAPPILERPQPLPVEQMARDCFYLEVIPATLSLDESIYGAMVFESGRIPCYDALYRRAEMEVQEGTMLLERRLTLPEKKNMLRFTQAHEMSHWILHRTYHDAEHRMYDLRTSKRPCTEFVACRTTAIEQADDGRKKQRTDTEWEEWQADSLAGAMLMPRDVFEAAAKDAFRRSGITRGYLMKNRDPGDAWQAIGDLAERFAVSRKAAIVRLRHLGLFFETEREAAEHLSFRF